MVGRLIGLLFGLSAGLLSGLLTDLLAGLLAGLLVGLFVGWPTHLLAGWLPGSAQVSHASGLAVQFLICLTISKTSQRIFGLLKNKGKKFQISSQIWLNIRESHRKF